MIDLSIEVMGAELLQKALQKLEKGIVPPDALLRAARHVVFLETISNRGLSSALSTILCWCPLWPEDLPDCGRTVGQNRPFPPRGPGLASGARVLG